MVCQMTEIKTTSRTVLRRMLRDCDRKLSWWDQVEKHAKVPLRGYAERCQTLDARRREIRRRLKERRDG